MKLEDLDSTYCIIYRPGSEINVKILYVGYSISVKRRLNEHRKPKNYIGLITDSKIEPLKEDNKIKTVKYTSIPKLDIKQKTFFIVGVSMKGKKEKALERYIMQKQKKNTYFANKRLEIKDSDYAEFIKN